MSDDKKPKLVTTMFQGAQMTCIPIQELQLALDRAFNCFEPQKMPQWAKELCDPFGPMSKVNISHDALLIMPTKPEEDEE